MVDPFNSVPTYSQKFIQPERTLPDLGSRPFAKEFFPPELHTTLDGDDGPATKKRKTGPKTLALSNITSLKTAEDFFHHDEDEDDGEQGEFGQKKKNDDPASYNKALRLFKQLEKRAEDGDDQGMLSGEDDDDWVKNPDDEDGEGVVEEDDAYEDEYESGDDYNAEAYFDGNQDDDDGNEGGGDDGGEYM